MSADIFHAVCQALGHDPSRVLSVRMNSRLVVVTTIDPAGHLRTVTCPPSDAGSSPPPAADGAPVSDAGDEPSSAGARRGPT
jgi:hypothetical protein